MCLCIILILFVVIGYRLSVTSYQLSTVRAKYSPRVQTQNRNNFVITSSGDNINRFADGVCFVCRTLAMPGKPQDEQRTENADRPTLTDRLNKYLLCAYLNRLNEEEPNGQPPRDGDDDEAENGSSDSRPTFSD